MTSLILRIEIGRADIDTPCECSQTRRWSAVGVQTSSAAENCKRAKSDSGAGAKIVHDGPESVFTLARNGRSRCAGIGVHVGPENAEMTVLNAGRFAGSGVGHCPETPHASISQAVAYVVHSPCNVMLNQKVENLLRRQFLVSVEREGLVDADGECVAEIDFETCGVNREETRFKRVILHGDALAVVGASDE